VLSADGLPKGKPDPGVYLHAATALQVEPVRCLAIEDSPAGVRAAKAAGMACVAVPAAGAETAIRSVGPDAEIASLDLLDEGVLRRAGLHLAAGT
jgi:beta-phosphoglucomutase